MEKSGNRLLGEMQEAGEGGGLPTTCNGKGRGKIRGEVGRIPAKKVG